MADGLEIVRDSGRILLRLRVAPGARRARIAGIHGGALKLSVTEPPERGRANEGVIALIARALALPARNLEIVSGQTSQDKRIAIDGFTGDDDDLARRLTGDHA